MAPLKGPHLTSSIALGTTEIRGYCQVSSALRGGPRRASGTTDVNLVCAFSGNGLDFVFFYKMVGPLAPPAIGIIKYIANDLFPKL